MYHQEEPTKANHQENSPYAHSRKYHLEKPTKANHQEYSAHQSQPHSLDDSYKCSLSRPQCQAGLCRLPTLDQHTIAPHLQLTRAGRPHHHWGQLDGGAARQGSAVGSDHRGWCRAFEKGRSSAAATLSSLHDGVARGCWNAVLASGHPAGLA